jgi:type IV secretory pathway TraG/TraD family ATPase VirD4
VSQDRSPAARPGAQDTAPWLILGGIGAGFVLFTGAWLGGTLGMLLAGGGWAPPAFGFATLATLLFRGGPGKVWPGHATAATVGMGVLAVALLAAAGAGLWLWLRVRPRTSGLATSRDLAAMAPRAARDRARQLRPSLASRAPDTVRPDETGVLLGRLEAFGGRELRASHEDTLLAVMAPRAGKTTSLAVPAILAAPGPVLATSNKPDLYTTTVTAQAARGTVWVIDPQGILHTPQALWWDMLRSAANIEGASRLASHFLAAGTDAAHRGDFWSLAAQNLLTALFHAARVGDKRVLDVLTWLATPSDRTPVTLLQKAGKEALARQLGSTVASAAPETRDGIYETARQAVSCLLDPKVLAWVTPDHRLPQFDPRAFVARPDTLYLLSKDGGGSAAGVTAAAADAVLRSAMATAERAAGRLDPPLLAVLDEAANVCRIADLPDLYSHLGSRGINPVTILQSYKQGVRVWGEHGMDALWSAATVKVLGAGLDDADFGDRVSRLIGEHYVPETSVSHGTTGRSVSTSRRRERVMDTGQIRALPKGTALLLATGLPVGLIRLQPWYTGPRASELDAARTTTEAAIARRAATEDDTW